MSDNSTDPAGTTLPDSADSDSCGDGSPYDGRLGLRIASIFIILVTSMFGALFPIVSRRVRNLRMPVVVFDFAKYFGSGVIIATAFIHLLAPAFDELSAPCLRGTWKDYDWAPALAMVSVFAIFLVEIIAFRWGMSRLEKLGIQYDAHGDGHAAHGPEAVGNHDARGGAEHEHHDVKQAEFKGSDSLEAPESETEMSRSQASAQILGVAILEFGVIFHSVIIGLTLAVSDDFTTLFIVLIFHQMFEGLGLGSRLAFLPLPQRLNWVPFVAGAGYACVTPIGIAIGLGVRTTYNPDSAAANIVSGVLDSISAGILLYTGLVELLAHEFIFNDQMRKASNLKLTYSLGCVLFGAGIMALLGRWA